MIVHASAEAMSGSGAENFEKVSADTRAEADFTEKLSELGLKRVDAYVRDGRGKKEPSKATLEKRKYRAQRKAEGIGQFVVEVPEDDDAKQTVYAVAKAIVDDKEGTKNTRSIIFSVVSSSAMLQLAQSVIASGTDVLSIIDLIDRGEIEKIDAIRAARPALFGDIASLAKLNPHFLSVLDALVRHAADVSDDSATDLLNAAAAASGRVELRQVLEVRRRGGLRAQLLSWALRDIN